MSLFEDWDWKRTLGDIAPLVATGLGGPHAGMAVRVLTEVLGIERDSSDPRKTEKQISDLLMSGDPEVMARIREAELKMEARMAEFGIDREQLSVERERIAVDDRKSARSLAIAEGQEPQLVLSALYTAGYFWLLHGLVTGSVTIGNDVRPLVNTLIGMMSAAQLAIMQFWFGSSAGSKVKDSISAMQSRMAQRLDHARKPIEP